MLCVTGEWGWTYGPYGSTKSCTSDVGKLDARKPERDKHLIFLSIDSITSSNICDPNIIVYFSFCMIFGG